LHICFGYAALVPGRPVVYSFLEELADSPVKQISIETAQSSLDCSVLARLPGKTIILGVIDLSTHEVETPEMVAARIRRALPFVSPERLVAAPDCGMKYLPAGSAFGKLRSLVGGVSIVRQELLGSAAAN
jgi:5-methyltetrahydropteroyltriglutamate--homocysteine methyltransferase